MPPRFAYWTILVGGPPTASRATDREELLPTFKRLQEKHPDAVMQWFSRGKLWESPAAAKAFFERGRVSHDDKPRARDWRPGGEHRDPRQKYIDAKKARNVEGRKKRFERRQQGEPGGRPDAPRDWTPQAPSSRPDSRRSERPRPQGPGGWTDRPTGPKPEGRRDWTDRPTGPKPEGRRDWTDRPPAPRAPGGPPAGKGGGRPSGPRAPRGPRGPKR